VTQADVVAPPGLPAIRLRDGVKYCVLVFLAVRIGLSLLSVTGVGLIDPRGGPLPAVAGWPIAPISAGWHNAVTGTERQDAAQFLAIATRGYGRDDGTAAFFPLYPMAVRAVAWLPGVGPLGAALLVSNASFLAALILLYGLTRLEFGGSTSMARRSVLFLAIFPTAFFFLAPYTESTFLLLSVAAFWFARRDRWAWAALMAALAAATRSVGILLAPALAVEAVLQWRAHGRALLPRLAAAAATALGPLAFFAYLGARFGNFWASTDAERTWDRTFTPAWTTIADAVRLATQDFSYWIVDLLVVGVVIVAVVAGIRRLRPSYLIYAFLSLLIELSVPFASRPLLSMPRFVAVIFPAFWVIAAGVERRRIPEPLVTGIFAAGYGILALLFMNWWHIF
jgi:Mannosyltransferase (PIG-V)